MTNPQAIPDHALLEAFESAVAAVVAADHINGQYLGAPARAKLTEARDMHRRDADWLRQEIQRRMGHV